MIGADDILVIRRAGYQIAQATPAAFSSILVRRRYFQNFHHGFVSLHGISQEVYTKQDLAAQKHYHYFYHIPSAYQQVTHQRGL